MISIYGGDANKALASTLDPQSDIGRSSLSFNESGIGLTGKYRAAPSRADSTYSYVGATTL